MKTLGLDISLTATGLVVLDGNKMVHKQILRSKKLGDKPIDETVRLTRLAEDIHEVVKEHRPDAVAIEGLAFAIRKTTSFAQLAALQFMVRRDLIHYTEPPLIVAPTTLKKFVTGKGNAQKDVMLLEIFKRWGVTFFDDNEADAYALARTAQAVFDKDTKTTAFQKEVVKLLNNQLLKV